MCTANPVLVSLDHTTPLGLNSRTSTACLLLPESALLPSLFPEASPGYQPAKTTMKTEASSLVGFSPSRSSGQQRKEPLLNPGSRHRDLGCTGGSSSAQMRNKYAAGQTHFSRGSSRLFPPGCIPTSFFLPVLASHL